MKCRTCEREVPPAPGSLSGVIACAHANPDGEPCEPTPLVYGYWVQKRWLIIPREVLDVGYLEGEVISFEVGPVVGPW